MSHIFYSFQIRQLKIFYIKHLLSTNVSWTSYLYSLFLYHTSITLLNTPFPHYILLQHIKEWKQNVLYMLRHWPPHFCQLTDLSLDVVHVLLGAQSWLAHNALGLGSGRRPQERMLAGTTGVNCQNIAARLRLVHSGDVVIRAFFTHKLGKMKSNEWVVFRKITWYNMNHFQWG